MNAQAAEGGVRSAGWRSDGTRKRAKGDTRKKRRANNAGGLGANPLSELCVCELILGAPPGANCFRMHVVKSQFRIMTKRFKVETIGKISLHMQSWNEVSTIDQICSGLNFETKPIIIKK